MKVFLWESSLSFSYLSIYLSIYLSLSLSLSLSLYIYIYIYIYILWKYKANLATSQIRQLSLSTEKKKTLSFFSFNLSHQFPLLCLVATVVRQRYRTSRSPSILREAVDAIHENSCHISQVPSQPMAHLLHLVPTNLPSFLECRVGQYKDSRRNAPDGRTDTYFSSFLFPHPPFLYLSLSLSLSFSLSLSLSLSIYRGTLKSSTCDSADLGVALASIIVDCLLDGGDGLVSPNGRKTNVVGLSFGSKLVLVRTRISLGPKPGHHFRRLLPDAKRSYYHCSVLIFHPGKW
ncbi:unnamed protein product [Acanthosepion pharaonis]|uniref:Uncharacterized protein n=1 Tax=Acanthosepion pharaonis TaxID=158019 RepID=A0A812C5B8_ACAPH|nr:unnamed protein product [Sepia pharaonis]